MSAPDDFRQIAAAFVRSSSFWEQTVPLCLAAVVLLALNVLLIRRLLRRGSRQSLRALARNESGSAEAMDFVLTMPFVMIFAFLFVQFLMGAQASLVVHYAAYSAARAARTAYFDLTINDVRIIQGQSLLTSRPLWQLLSLTNGGKAHQRADNAARIALMSAVPATLHSTANPQGSGAGVLAAVGALNVPAAAARSKAVYAFTPGNAAVTVGIVKSFEIMALARNLQSNALPVWARVEFRYPLVMPAVAGLFRVSSYTLSAEVTVL